MNKEIKFSMKFDADNSALDAVVSKLNQKLKEAAGTFKTAMSGAMGGGPGAGGAAGAGNAGMDQFFKSLQSLRTNHDKALRDHAKEQMKLMKDIAKEEERHNKLLQDQEKMSKNKNKDLAEELRIKKDLKNVEEQISRLNQERGRGKTSFDAARGAAYGGTMPVFVTNWPDGGGPGGGAGGGGGGGGGGGRGGRFSGMAKTIGTVAAILATGAAIADQYSMQSIIRNASQGNATQSIIGNQLQDLSAGRSISVMGWQKERSEALEIARKRMEVEQITGPMKFLSGATKKLLSGVGIGSGTDQDSNYASGVISKALEKVFDVGGLIPNKLSKSLGKASDEYFSTQQSQMLEEFGKNYEETLAAKQKQDPLKNLAINFMQDRYRTDLQSQRMMGLTDDQFYGRRGFLEIANKAGFTGDMAVEQARQIQAAGGSTRGMQNATLGLQAARGFDLTNAGSILGTISGGAGSQEASERIFKRILAEGVKTGLDTADSVEELRRFSQQTAEVVARTGATDENAISAIISNFSRFQAGAGGTIREQQGAMEAYQEAQGFSAETGGRGGAIQFAALMKQGLGGIGAAGLGGLMEMPEQDINADNPYIIAEAAKSKMTPEALVDKIKKAKREKARVEVGISQEELDIVSGAGVDKELTKDELAALPEDVQKAYIDIAEKSRQKSGYKDPQKAAAVLRGLLTNTYTEDQATGAGGKTPEQAAVDEKLKTQTGRAGDAATAAEGAAQQAFLENFREFKKEITPTATAVDGLTKSLILLAQVASSAKDPDRAATLKYATEQIEERAKRDAAQQAGKPPPAGNK